MQRHYGLLPLLHPNLAKYYHEEIAALHDQLGNEETRAQVVDKLRTLVSRIKLVPDGAELVIVLRGDLAAILTFASGRKKLGIKEVDDGIWVVSFMYYDLGYIDLEQRTL